MSVFGRLISIFICISFLAGCRYVDPIPDGNVLPANGTVYGHDDRQDYYSVENESVRELFHSVAIMTYASYLTEQEDGSFVLTPYSTYGRRYKMHQTHPFHGQPLAGFCSAFLVSDTMIATAGHCVDDWTEEKMASIRFVFGFMMTGPDEPVLRFEANQVYGVRRIVSTEYNLLTGNDYAVLELDKVVEGIEPLALSNVNVLEHQEVFMIGHPSGSPMKLADDAYVSRVDRISFKSSIDAFTGNSGSPVFDRSGSVVGILVRRDLYSIRDPRGYVDWTMPTRNNGRGNASIHISVWRNYVE